MHTVRRLPTSVRFRDCATDASNATCCTLRALLAEGKRRIAWLLQGAGQGCCRVQVRAVAGCRLGLLQVCVAWPVQDNQSTVQTEQMCEAITLESRVAMAHDQARTPTTHGWPPASH
jgi:hypothetical protein